MSKKVRYTVEVDYKSKNKAQHDLSKLGAIQVSDQKDKFNNWSVSFAVKLSDTAIISGINNFLVDNSLKYSKT